jgi:sugar lactone lactonase YvrE
MNSNTPELQRSTAAFFNPRAVIAFALCGAGLSLAAIAPTPVAGNPSLATPVVSQNSPLLSGGIGAGSLANPVLGQQQPAAVSVPQPAAASAAAGDQVWVTRYNGSGNNGRRALAVAVSPDGSRVYVTGDGGDDYATVAYDATTGDQLWLARYDRSGGQDTADALALSPDGSRVYVTGYSYNSAGTDVDFATVAYDATTGAQLWVTLYGGPGNDADSARAAAVAVVVSPDGSRVYVTGTGWAGAYYGYATVAYDATTGEQLWIALYDGGGASAMAQSADGSRIYVAGSSVGDGTAEDYATVAYDATTGNQLWVARYDYPGNVYKNGHQADLPDAVAVSPDGSKVYVTGGSYFYVVNYFIYSSIQYATVAYDATTGAQLWASLYDTSPGRAWAHNVAVSPDGSRIYVSGSSVGDGTGNDYATLAYDATTGAQLWASRYTGDGVSAGFLSFDDQYALGISPDGSRLYVTGTSASKSYGADRSGNVYATVSYDATTGNQLWVAQYGAGDLTAYALALSPDGSRVYVTGGSTIGDPAPADWATVAYNTGFVPVAGVVSRKVHGNAGTRDVNLPLAGPHAIECRSGGASNEYTVVFRFANPLTSVASASVTSGAGSVATANIDSNDAHDYIVNLTGVTNAQKLTVSLTDVTDSLGNFSASVPISFGVLLGDTTGDGVVNSTDIAQTKSQSGTNVTNANFREDVTAEGSLNSTDIALVKSKSGTGLPQ